MAAGWAARTLVGLLDEAGIDRAVVMTYTELPAVNPFALLHARNAPRAI